MAKHSSMYIPLPMPPTSEEKFAIYVSIKGDIEMFLYDGKQVFTPDFPDIPIERIDLEDGRVVRQETLARICRYMMTHQTVEYNKEFDFWEALPNDPF
jgi:hypothetical protein